LPAIIQKGTEANEENEGIAAEKRSQTFGSKVHH
jgi:hypothetical protein